MIEKVLPTSMTFLLWDLFYVKDSLYTTDRMIWVVKLFGHYADILCVILILIEVMFYYINSVYNKERSHCYCQCKIILETLKFFWLRLRRANKRDKFLL